MKHYLDFGADSYGRIEISEVVKFDQFGYRLFQDEGRFGRDKTIGAEKADLVFWKGYFQHADATRLGIYGQTVFELTHCFDELIETRKKGFEQIVYYIVSDGVEEFVNGQIDFPESKTDGFSYFSCSVVQEYTRAVLERKGNTIINTMDSVDTFGDPIAPIVKQKVLLKAFPINVKSDWKTSSPLNIADSIYGGGADRYIWYNPAQSLGEYKIDDSYTPFEVALFSNNPEEYAKANFRYIFAKTKLTNLTIDIRDLVAVRQVMAGDLDPAVRVQTYLIIRWGNSFLDIDSQAEILSYDELTNAVTFSIDTNDYSFTIPVLEQNQSVYIYFLSVTRANGPFNNWIFAASTSLSVYVNGVSIGIDSVIDAARYEDFIAKGVESACGLPINAPDLITGDYKDQFVWTGNDMRQKAESLPCVLKNELEDLREPGMDWQTNSDAVEIAKYEDFYPDNYLGHYGDIAPTDFEELPFNPRAKVINLNNSYKNYEKADQSIGTNQSFHTELQLLFPNNQVENDIKLQINHTRDPLRIENTRRKIILQTTAQETDNEIFIAPFVQIAPGTKGGFTAGLQHNVLPDGRVQILNRAASDDSIGNFDWTLLGFGLGSSFSFTIFGITLNYTVSAPLDRNVLTLSPIAGQPQSSFLGFTMTKVEYPFTNVLYQIQTNEGFDQVLNLNNQGEGANLFYTQKRNLLRLGSLLHTICLDSLKYPTCQIQVKGFKNNGKLVTQYNGGAVITEDAPILMTDLPAPRINTRMIKTRVPMTLAQGKDLINRATMRNADGTIGGYITTPDKSGKAVAGYIKEMNMVWAQGFMELVLEERYEQQPTTIAKVGSDIFIQQSGFPTVPVADANNGWFEVLNGYFIAYSAESRQLITPVPYRSVSVDGVMYVDLVEFLDAVGVVYS